MAIHRRHTSGMGRQGRALRACWVALLLGVAIVASAPDAEGQALRVPPVGVLVYPEYDGTTKRSRIYIQRPGEPAAQRVYDEPGIMNQATWSPDGAHISFSNDGIFVMDADGSNVRKLVDEEFWSPMPHTWGPEGGQITFYDPSSELGGELLILDVENPRNQRLLRETGRMHHPPAWSPDRTRDMVKSCVWRSGGVLGCDDFVVVPDSVLEDDSSDDIG